MKDFKVYVGCEEISKIIQELAFEKGYYWSESKKTLNLRQDFNEFISFRNGGEMFTNNFGDFDQLPILEAIEYLKGTDDENVQEEAKESLKEFLKKQQKELNEFVESMWSK